MVRAKFVCTEITTSGFSLNGEPQVNAGKRYVFKAVYSSDPNHENKTFFDATPNAELMMVITNTAGQIFEVGHEYYLDFTPAT